VGGAVVVLFTSLDDDDERSSLTPPPQSTAVTAAAAAEDANSQQAAARTSDLRLLLRLFRSCWACRWWYVSAISIGKRWGLSSDRVSIHVTDDGD